MPPLQNIDIILNWLIGENPQYSKMIILSELVEKRQLMRSLMNIRPAREASKDFLEVQDTEIQKQLHEKGIVELKQAIISPIDNKLGLWIDRIQSSIIRQ